MRVATLALICAALVGLVTADGAAADSIAEQGPSALNQEGTAASSATPSPSA